MRKFVMAMVLIGLFVLPAATALADPLWTPGNELINGDFEMSDDGAPPIHWSVVPATGVLVTPDGLGNPGQGVRCAEPTYTGPNGAWGDQMRQIADERIYWIGEEQYLNEYWNDNYRRKLVDLSIDVRGATANSPDDPIGVRVRFDYWDMKWNDPVYGIANLPTVPDGGYTDWVELDYNPLSDEWVTQNIRHQFEDTQPRWISVEIEFMQPADSVSYIDNVILTGVCQGEEVIPEPATMSLLGLGLLAALRRRRRK